ncbi:MAG: hypothetical protein RLZZ297_776 [Chloroflexota bacterium]|jgi:PhnB protein
MADIVPYLACTPARQAVAWYAKVFDATCTEFIPDGSELVSHAELSTASARFFVSSVYPEQHLHDGRSAETTTTAVVFLCTDIAPVTERALAAGATLLRPIAPGHNAKIRDPFGHVWIIFQQRLAGK